MEEIGKGVDCVAEEGRDWDGVQHRDFGRGEAEVKSVAGYRLRTMVKSKSIA